MTTTLEQTLGQLADSEERRAGAFERLARAAAAGGVPTPAELAEALHDARKTTWDFRNQVRLFEQRAADRAEIVALRAQLENEKPALHARIKEENDKLERHVQEHARNVRPFRERLRELEEGGQRAIRLQSELIARAPQELRARREELQRLRNAFQAAAFAQAKSNLQRIQQIDATRIAQPGELPGMAARAQQAFDEAVDQLQAFDRRIEEAAQAIYDY
jgi:hypothetical protein